jgi:hypothetical protein
MSPWNNIGTKTDRVTVSRPGCNPSARPIPVSQDNPDARTSASSASSSAKRGWAQPVGSNAKSPVCTDRCMTSRAGTSTAGSASRGMRSSEDSQAEDTGALAKASPSSTSGSPLGAVASLSADTLRGVGWPAPVQDLGSVIGTPGLVIQILTSS